MSLCYSPYLPETSQTSWLCSYTPISNILPFLIKLGIINNSISTCHHPSCHFPTPGHLYHVRGLLKCFHLVFLPPVCCFFLLISLLRYKSHGIKFTHIKYTVQCLLVYPQSSAAVPLISAGPFVLPPKMNLVTNSRHSPFFSHLRQPLISFCSFYTAFMEMEFRYHTVYP